jgi:phosphoesterase RecJ-like protein
MRLAADLLEAGVDHTRLYAMIEQRDGAPRWKLLGRSLSSLELHDGGRIAIMKLRSADFDDCGADRNDTSGFADMVLSIETVRVSVILTEGELPAGSRDAPVTKVSMRSKPGPHAVDVNNATNALGGGGHARAAGAKMDGVSLETARERVLAVLASHPERA